MKGTTIFWILIILFVVTMVFHNELFSISINVFLFIDRLIFTNENMNPIVIWGIFGAFVGLIYGGFVAWKKYKLEFKLNFIPITLFLMIIAALYLINQPLKLIAESNVKIVAKYREFAYKYISIPSSSTYLPRTSNNSYAPSNLIDDNYSSAWIENAPGPGLNQRIDYEFPLYKIGRFKIFTCIGLKIKNGYSKSYKLWNEHNRVKDFVVLHNNIPIANFQAKNSYSLSEEILFQSVIIKPGDVISLSIKSTYSGNKFPNQTAITELIPIIMHD